MPSVLSVIEDQRARWAGTGAGVVDRDVLGTDDPGEIAEIFESFCVRELGAPVGGLFYVASAGCVLGVRLRSGDDVVVKAYQRRWRAPLLAAVQRVEEQVARGGIPCPRPLVPPQSIRNGRPNLAVVETYLPDPGMRPGGSVAARRVSAAGLAAQIALCHGLPGAARQAVADHPLRSDGAGLYGTPHSPLFDFETTGRAPNGSTSSLGARSASATTTRKPRWWRTPTGRRATCASTRIVCWPSTTGTAWRS